MSEMKLIKLSKGNYQRLQQIDHFFGSYFTHKLCQYLLSNTNEKQTFLGSVILQICTQSQKCCDQFLPFYPYFKIFLGMHAWEKELIEAYLYKNIGQEMF